MLGIGKIRKFVDNSWNTTSQRAEIHFSTKVKAQFIKVQCQDKNMFFFCQNIVSKYVNPTSKVAALVIAEKGETYGIEIHTIYDGSTKLDQNSYDAFIEKLVSVEKVKLSGTVMQSTVVPDESRYNLFVSIFCDVFDNIEGKGLSFAQLVTKSNQCLKEKYDQDDKFDKEEVQNLVKLLQASVNGVEIVKESVYMK